MIWKVKVRFMTDEYDFSQRKENSYAKVLKKQITINLSDEIVDYFKSQSAECKIPYQTLIKLYLQNCIDRQAKPKLEWFLLELRVLGFEFF